MASGRHQLDFFGQDALKITKNLSLDYGVRYEYNSPQEDPHNQIQGWFPGAAVDAVSRLSARFPVSRRSGNAQSRT